MSDVKYRIGFGNCDTSINDDIIPPTVSIKWDSTQYTFDSTIITFDSL
jgi:hypothetical protein